MNKGRNRFGEEPFFFLSSLEVALRKPQGALPHFQRTFWPRGQEPSSTGRTNYYILSHVGELLHR